MKITTVMVIRAALELAQDQLAEKYQAGAPIAQLARETGLSSWQVTKRLKDAGVHTGQGRHIQRRQKMCRAGLHDLDVHGKQRWVEKPDGTKVKNGRQCMECARLWEAQHR